MLLSSSIFAVLWVGWGWLPFSCGGSLTNAFANLICRQSFERLFFSLPNELHVLILKSLSLQDLLDLRILSRSWHTLVTLHEVPFVRHYLANHVPAYALRLYPVRDNTSLNLHHLCSIWHRLHVATKLSHLICEWAVKDIFLRTTDARRLEFAPQSERMYRRLVPLVFTVFHFFEQYRILHEEYIREHDGVGLHLTPYTLNPVEVQVMSMYDDATLLRVHEVFPLVIASFCRRLRPPTYIGRVERSIRGYLRDKPPDEVHSAILCLGGLRQVEKLWEVKGYGARRHAVDVWYSSVSRPPVDPSLRPSFASRSDRSFINMGRKKASQPATVVSHDWTSSHGVGSADGTSHHSDSSYIFHTSLASGMPMSPLPASSLASLLPDMPVLQQIWLVTAEALILERKIVERPQDISRNTQVLLDLIREDGFELGDEWSYGATGSPSVRPPPGSADDDDPSGY